MNGRQLIAYFFPLRSKTAIVNHILVEAKSTDLSACIKIAIQCGNLNIINPKRDLSHEVILYDSLN